MRHILALLTGLVFGVGLSVSGMINPDRVQGFLDITGAWNPILAFVLGGAVLTSILSFHFILKQPHPLLDKQFYMPTKTQIDRPLLVGAVLFGMGWGLFGYCPGPALAALVYFEPTTLVFVGSMVAGLYLARWWTAYRQSKV